MNTTQIIQQLRHERERIDRAILALEELEGSATTPRGPGRPKGSGNRGPRFMSAEARARISEKMRQRWAERKAKAS